MKKLATINILFDHSEQTKKMKKRYIKKEKSTKISQRKTGKNMRNPKDKLKCEKVYCDALIPCLIRFDSILFIFLSCTVLNINIITLLAVK